MIPIITIMSKILVSGKHKLQKHLDFSPPCVALDLSLSRRRTKMYSQFYTAMDDMVYLGETGDDHNVFEKNPPIIQNPSLEKLMEKYPQAFTNEFKAILNKRF